MLFSPMEWRRIFNEIVEGFALHNKIFDIATFESEASQHLHNVSFAVGWLKIL